MEAEKNIHRRVLNYFQPNEICMNVMILEMRKQTLTLVIAALGFVAALVWKDAISAWLKPLYESAEGPTGLTIAAIVVTVIVVLITVVLTKVLGSVEEAKK